MRITGKGLGSLLLEKGPGPERVCLGSAGSVGVLNFAQESFQNMSPGDFERMFIKVGDSKKEGPGIEKATGEAKAGLL